MRKSEIRSESPSSSDGIAFMYFDASRFHGKVAIDFSDNNLFYVAISSSFDNCVADADGNFGSSKNLEVARCVFHFAEVDRSEMVNPTIHPVCF